jgi:hypothetical protein
MGEIVRLMPRTREGIIFAIKHEYAKLVQMGLVPETKSWPRMQRELDLFRTKLEVRATFDRLERGGTFKGGTFEDFDEWLRNNPRDDGPAAA